ncbi:MAG: LysM peptidoglycan-binding domain-containing protein [Bacteroidales bacterium]|nr:LysM peptidoglycan-binding domain-containing protein [Bacteroidales bacterium]
MQCPVCNKSGIPEEAITCPECQSDLQSLHLIEKIDKSHRNRLYLSVILAVALLLVAAAWIFTGLNRSSHGTKESVDAGNALITESTVMSELKAENAALAAANEKLTAEITQLKAKKETGYVVKEGESLFTIARKIFGNGFRYTEIAEANNIADPNKIVVGQKLKILY